VKTQAGNLFEDFSVGQEIAHATPRTLNEGDVSLYTALYGSRFAVNASSPFAASLGLRASAGARPASGEDAEGRMPGGTHR
jgi:2-methylfumaryl-CoA hydratase